MISPRSSRSPPGSSARATCTSTTGTCGAPATGFSASIVDLATYVVNNQARLRADGSSLVLPCRRSRPPKGRALERHHHRLEAHLGLAAGTVKTYVLVEQLEAVFS
jgi:malate synthase